MKKILLKSTYTIYSLCILSLFYIIAICLFKVTHPIAMKLAMVSILIIFFAISYTIFLTIIALIPLKLRDILKLFRRFMYTLVTFSVINITLDLIIKRKIDVIHSISSNAIGIAFGLTFFSYIFKYLNETKE